MRLASFLALPILLVGTATTVSAQGDPIQWTLKATPAGVRGTANDKITLLLHATIAAGWHLYSVYQEPGGPTPTRISIPGGQTIQQAGKIQEPQPATAFDDNFNIMTQFFEGGTTFRIPAKLTVRPPAKTQEVKVDVMYQICNDRMCLPPKLVTLKTTLKLSDQDSAPNPAPSGH